MNTVTLASQKYMNELRDCYIDVDGLNNASCGSGGVSFPEYLLLPSQLAKLMIKIIVEKNPLIKGLPEAQEVILKFAPYSLETIVKNEIRNYLAEASAHSAEIRMNVEGFVNFRLKEYAACLNRTIRSVIQNYMVQEKYYSFLNMLKCYIDESKPVSAELHISSKTRYEDAEQVLEILIELLPEKVIIYDRAGFKDKNLLRCIEYVFDKRIEYEV